MAEYPKDAVAAIISNGLRRVKTSRRHPAEVTSDRLGEAVTRWHDQFTPEERDAVAVIRARLEEIAEARTLAGFRT